MNATVTMKEEVRTDSWVRDIPLDKIRVDWVVVYWHRQSAFRLGFAPLSCLSWKWTERSFR